MADLKTNLLGFVMNSPVIGASGTVATVWSTRNLVRVFPRFGGSRPGKA